MSDFIGAPCNDISGKKKNNTEKTGILSSTLEHSSSSAHLHQDFFHPILAIDLHSQYLHHLYF